jgi:outer membrane lipoprotein-sorting protein
MSDKNVIEHRDDELGAALRALDVPEHRPGFHFELRRRLQEESAARTAATRRVRRRWALRVGVVAAAAAVLVAAVGIPRTDRTPRIAGPDVATAAEIKTQVRAALAELENLSGTFVSDGPQRGDERRWRFVVTADGDFRLDGPTPGEVITYDAGTGVARSAQRSASIDASTIFFAERRGVAPGPPDLGPPTWVLPDEFGSFVRALLAASDPRVRETTYEGRPAWRLDVDVAPNAIAPEFSGDRLELTVDRATGIPVRVLERKNGSFLSELRIEDVAVDERLAPDSLRFEFPAGAEVMRSDEGFRRIELVEVADAVGYGPLVPSWVPDGYDLAEVAVAAESAPTGAEAGNPFSRMVVSLSYRRGIDQLVVTTRLAGGATWDDPLATGEGFVDRPQPLTVGGGALAGIEAELVLMPRGLPHVWAVANDLVVTVAGDLGRAELVRVTESLRASP